MLSTEIEKSMIPSFRCHHIDVEMVRREAYRKYGFSSGLPSEDPSKRGIFGRRPRRTEEEKEAKAWADSLVAVGDEHNQIREEVIERERIQAQMEAIKYKYAVSGRLGAEELNREYRELSERLSRTHIDEIWNRWEWHVRGNPILRQGGTDEQHEPFPSVRGVR